MTTHIVKTRSVHGHQVRLAFDDGYSLFERRFLPVSAGAILKTTPTQLSLQLQDGSLIPVSPAWKETTSFQVGDIAIPLNIKEVETSSELDGFLRLTKYHYRGAKGAGRTIPLVVTTSRDDLPEVLGFIEIATSFLVNSARKKALDAAFSDSERGVGWTRWDGAAARKWINSIARISRCVVFPEFRGLGLSSLLLDSAVRYTRERWHVGGLRPVFLEITADMLRYWPFVHKSDFIYVGETEGNEHRAAQDMRYLITRAASKVNGSEGMPRGGGGILSFQRKRAVHLKKVVDDTGLSVEDVVNHLRMSPDKLSDEEWVLLHTAYRRPKPTYLRGLTTAAQRFLLTRVSSVPQNHAGQDSFAPHQIGSSKNSQLLDIQDLTILAHSRPVSSKRSRRVQEAFGMVSELVEIPIIEDMAFAIRAGEIVLVTGPSGSGKSLLLDAVEAFAQQTSIDSTHPGLTITGRLQGAAPSIGRPIICPPETAPVDALEHLSLESTLRLMAVAGLAEPQVLIRPSSTLSLGQQYRLSLALGLSHNVDLFLVDEFCEALDQFSATAVARHMRRNVSSTNKGAIVATSRPSSFLSALRPDRTLVLSSDGRFTWRSTLKEFL